MPSCMLTGARAEDRGCTFVNDHTIQRSREVKRGLTLYMLKV